MRNQHTRVSLTLELKAPKYPRVEVIKILAYYVPLDYNILKKEKILNSDSLFLRNYNNRVNLTLNFMPISLRAQIFLAKDAKETLVAKNIRNFFEPLEEIGEL